MGPFSSASDRNSAAAAAAAAASATATPSPQSRTPAAAAPDDSSTSKKFLKRLSILPLRSRTRNIADFHIRPDDPHRKYSAGDHVQGAVVLTVVKPVRITHLTVLLHGYVRVYKGPGAQNNEPVRSPAEIHNISSRGERKKYYNGYASLFQDEQVLSSDGRLEPGRYEFNFDLLFPADGLPSSIDFERGTISYMITATLTRPTSVAPTTSCERKICLMEKLDVGPLAPPKAQTVDLRPISKRTKKKRPAGGDRRSVISSERLSADVPEPLSDGESARMNDTSTEGSLSVVGDDVGQEGFSQTPRSVQHSEVRSLSGDSAASLSTHPSRAHSETNQLAIVGSAITGKRISFADERTIKLTVEVLKGGCLPGDMIPVRVSVNHIKMVKSMHGVIVTLFRQGRIDSSPLQLSTEEWKKSESDDYYYPKSRTGLSGLSLSSAGSCSMFRKDLSQAFAPLITDPLNFFATLTTSVRVPEDSFPTIKGVPGEMISFKYFVEVIVDLGGKLANHLQGGVSSGSRVGATGVVGNTFENVGTLPVWGATGSTSILDTDHLKRVQGVIPGYYEVIVGTTDSNRLRGKGPQRPSLTHTPSVAGGPSYLENEYNEKGGWSNSLHDDDGYGPESANPDDDYASYPPRTTHPHDYVHQPPYWNYVAHSSTHEQEVPAPHYIPPPDLPDENRLTEKERIRRAEQRLLPSQPPIAAASSSSAAISSPSASNYAMDSSLLLNGDNIYDAEDDVPTPAATPATASPFEHTLAPEYTPTPAEDLPSAPTLEELDQPPPIFRGPSHHPLSSTEDKQELERRRLLAEASAPPEFPEDYIPDENGGSVTPAGPSPGAEPSASPSAPVAAFEPSAPVFYENDEDYHGGGYTAAGPSVPSDSGRNHEEETVPEYTYNNHLSGSVGTVTVVGGLSSSSQVPTPAFHSSGHAHDSLGEQEQQARSDSSSPPPVEYLPRYER
ncbi:pH-response regulator protein palF/prr-3 [Pseudoneurospora amorphoporcata]|uniref:PH-response regulator protein palF/prr-3 n=1 Tax=Pseudoneurospora amorphoporcata TaxID=241081 RepID=A0AAN6SFE3_9PEZI|nr:pH-response regulator protein palF/prr-3 [Pseudoneurospora amorphoporcata]